MRENTARIGAYAGLVSMMLIAALAIAFLVAAHVGVGHAVVAHGLQGSWCNGLPGPCANPA